MDRSTQDLTWEHDAIIDSSSDNLFVCDAASKILGFMEAGVVIRLAGIKSRRLSTDC